ncbi:hypothetical protein KQX54_009317 [Cotesia glomerata]|uniref:Uncharacterized protein n=1 Tax=Cotesia glomerata TaxID=32391 RepID=A0AAV7J2N9_COTGL|nr:hypothetical protein KQX54_009317 [Cotesia glomerata]
MKYGSMSEFGQPEPGFPEVIYITELRNVSRVCITYHRNQRQPVENRVLSANRPGSSMEGLLQIAFRTGIDNTSSTGTRNSVPYNRKDNDGSTLQTTEQTSVIVMERVYTFFTFLLG